MLILNSLCSLEISKVLIESCMEVILTHKTLAFDLQNVHADDNGYGAELLLCFLNSFSPTEASSNR